MKAMELSQKVFCIVDDNTFEWLHHWKWSLAVNSGDVKYARRLCTNPVNQKRIFVYMHKLISGVSKNYTVRFRDCNPLNMQRANMRVTNLRGELVKWWGSTGVSKFVGVEWDRYNGLWKAHIHGLVVGYYVGEIEAAEAYNAKADEVLGSQAVLNDTVMRPE